MPFFFLPLMAKALAASKAAGFASAAADATSAAGAVAGASKLGMFAKFKQTIGGLPNTAKSYAVENVKGSLEETVGNLKKPFARSGRTVEPMTPMAPPMPRIETRSIRRPYGG